MLFAAGLGTRMKPLTDDRPKALVEVGGRPMLEWIIRRLIQYGFNEIVINVHHFADMVIDFVRSHDGFGAVIHFSDERDQLLDTGGGLKKAQHFFDEPFLVHNVDIICNTNLKALYEYHLKNKTLATLSVKDRETSRSLLVNHSHLLCGWHNNLTGETKMSRMEKDLYPVAFSGIHVISPALLALIEEQGAFSIMDVYLRLASSYDVMVMPDNQCTWIDIGRKENITDAAKVVASIMLNN